MKKTALRLVPGALVAALLVATLFSSSPPPAPRSAFPLSLGPNPALAALAPPSAVLTTTDTLYMPPAGGVTQPVAGPLNLAGATVTLLPIVYSAGVFDVLDWDPGTLAPDPTTVALRSQYFSASALILSHVTCPFGPPVVMNAVANVAEAPRSVIALDYRVVDPYNPQYAIFFPDGPADELAGFQEMSGTRSALPGSHPVIDYSLNASDPSLAIVQEVRTTNGWMGQSWVDMVQRFRVPARTRLRWVELAFDQAVVQGGLDAGTIAILDAQGADVPPDVLPASLCQATFFVPSPPEPVWANHNDFNQLVTLEPDHDYWLYVQTLDDYSLRARMKTGLEGPAFVAGIGPAFARASVPGAWTALADRSLSFKLIGDQVDVTGVGPPAPGRGSFAFAISPNPSRGAVLVRWSGAAGALWLDVFDARGARVARAEGAPGGAGQWRWSGIDGSGRPLPAGAYFVRGTDDAGRVAIQRVVLIR